MLRSRMLLVLGLAVALACHVVFAGEADPYETYVKTSKDFKPVKQDKDWLLKAFPSWVYMPWQNVGNNSDEGAEYYKKIGWNGQTIDFRGGTGPLAWIEKNKLRFYCDHTAEKGFLHIWDSGNHPEIFNTGMRTQVVNGALKEKLEGFIKNHINSVKASSLRLAYVLDDEISWGFFSKPAMWHITDDQAAFPAWLDEIYGKGNAPKYNGWASYDSVWPAVPGWKVKDFNVSQLMDQWTFNDSYWNNFIGDLVTYANTIDPETPCGYEGGQGAAAFGGYDVAKYMRKIQFLESYSGGSIIRSFNPHNAIPTVTTHFFQSVADSAWQCWYNLAHGNKGHIGWVEKRPAEADAEKIAPSYHDAANKVGPLMSGSEWVHDGVALYYNQASIQLSWIMDAQPHTKTWRNRKSEGMSTQLVSRKAWENMLKDDGLQYNFINYVDVVQNGVPKEYKVLILNNILCLSDAEAKKIKEFCNAGGTVIADYMPGLWDQHGKAHPNGGVLDDMFGVKHSPTMGAADVFQGNGLWCEVNQDGHYGQGGETLLSDNKSIMDKSGFNKAVRDLPVCTVNKYGQGKAVLMNLSAQWYEAYRTHPAAEAAAKRNVFTQYVKNAVGTRWVQIEGAGDKENGYEITYWSKGDRTILFLCFNPEITAGSMGGGNSVGLKTATVPVTLTFAQPLKGVKDERTGKDLGDGKQFKFEWPMGEAVVLSFAGTPPAKPAAK